MREREEEISAKRKNEKLETKIERLGEKISLE